MTRAEIRAYAQRYEREHPSPPSAEVLRDVKRILAPTVNALERRDRRHRDRAAA